MTLTSMSETFRRGFRLSRLHSESQNSFESLCLGLQHASYNMNPEKTVLTRQFPEFYYYQHECLSENWRFLHVSCLRQVISCPAPFGSLLRNITLVLPLMDLLRRPKLN